MRSVLAYSLILAGSLVAGSLTASAHAAELTLDVSGFSSSEGALMVAAFQTSGDWLKKSVAAERVPLSQARDGKISVTLKDLPEGPVAISLYHDKNGNGKLDANLMGMPTEPYAFSRQAKGNFGPPRFEDALLPAGTRQHAIQLTGQ